MRRSHGKESSRQVKARAWRLLKIQSRAAVLNQFSSRNSRPAGVTLPGHESAPKVTDRKDVIN